MELSGAARVIAARIALGRQLQAIAGGIEHDKWPALDPLPALFSSFDCRPFGGRHVIRARSNTDGRHAMGARNRVTSRDGASGRGCSLQRTKLRWLKLQLIG